ncbi:MAG: hypothetical protein LAP21_24350 [Acidobacteriia bacterium]|nr:hypothetical protein [Terriglobia bacterium]
MEATPDFNVNANNKDRQSLSPTGRRFGNEFLATALESFGMGASQRRGSWWSSLRRF